MRAAPQADAACALSLKQDLPRKSQAAPIDTPWYDATLVIGLSAFDLGLAALAATAAYIAILVALRIARATALRLSSQGSLHGAGSAAGVVAEILSGTSQFLMLLTALLIGIGTLHLAEPWSARVSHLWFLTLMLQIALWANRAVTLGLGSYFKRHTAEGGPASASSTLLSWALRTALWTVAALAILSNVGVNITAFVASLGIGGVAVALAVQNILGDLFASLSIAIDKPFEVGDVINVGAVTGGVEYVGLKTTRIRSLNGEQVIMSNADLLKQTVSNYKRMATRRVVLVFGVTYSTTPEQMEAIPPAIKSMIEAEERARFGRAHFKGFGDSALNFEVVYTVLSPDYDLFMDVQQKFGLQLMRDLKRMGVDFAFPSRTVHLGGGVEAALTGQLLADRAQPMAATAARSGQPLAVPAQSPGDQAAAT